MANKRKTKKYYNRGKGSSSNTSVNNRSSLFNKEGKINWDTEYSEKKGSSSKSKIGFGSIVAVGGVIVLGLALTQRL
jgi:hypothetical protein